MSATQQTTLDARNIACKSVFATEELFEGILSFLPFKPLSTSEESRSAELASSMVLSLCSRRCFCGLAMSRSCGLWRKVARSAPINSKGNRLNDTAPPSQLSKDHPNPTVAAMGFPEYQRLTIESDEGAGCDRTSGTGGETRDTPYQLPDVFLSALRPRRGLFSASTP